jgi:hypothetical protein
MDNVSNGFKVLSSALAALAVTWVMSLGFVHSTATVKFTNNTVSSVVAAINN